MVEYLIANFPLLWPCPTDLIKIKKHKSQETLFGFSFKIIDRFDIDGATVDVVVPTLISWIFLIIKSFEIEPLLDGSHDDGEFLINIHGSQIKNNRQRIQ